MRALLVALALLLPIDSLALPSERLRIGLYQNSPKVDFGPTGRGEGIFVDIIEAIAASEGWTIEYVPGTWGEGLARLQAGEIDLMPDVALTPERKALFAFHPEPVLSSWQQVYAQPDSGIRSLLDLHGRRTAVLEGSVQQEQLVQMAAGFDVRIELVAFPDFDAAFTAVSEGRAEAVVTNRFYGTRHAERFGLVDTAVIFNPSTLHFAARRDAPPHILAAIDRRLLDLKSDPSSAYYDSLRSWLSGEWRPTASPHWLPAAAAATVALILAFVVWLGMLRWQVALRTRQLQTRHEEAQVVNRTLRTTTTRLDLPSVLKEALQGARDLSGCDGGVFCLYDPGLDRLEVSATLDACPADGPPHDNSLRASTCPSLAVPVLPEKGQRYLVLDARKSDSITPCVHARDPGVRWNLMFPVAVRERTIGVLCLHSRRERPPSPRRLEQVSDLCAPIALAIENARLYAAMQHEAQVLEHRVRERTEELETANRELLVAKHAAEAADRLKSAFLATMSHELRTPLNSIIGFTGILLQQLAGPLNDEQNKQLGMVQTSARHLLALINDVLDISKIEAGQFDVARERFDLPSSLDKVASLVRPQAARKGLELVVHVEDELPPMTGDARRVEQILLNLLSNALKFTEKGSVTLHACKEVDFLPEGVTEPIPAVTITIADTGCGIKPEDLSMLFKPFRQIDSTLSRAHEGTGLGLAICRRLTELMGGRITVESRWGSGSRFSVTLPCTLPEREDTQ